MTQSTLKTFDVSVIVPTYNPDIYIEDCLKSIYQQDFGSDRFEVLIVLNGNIDLYKSKLQTLILQAPSHLSVTLLKSVNPGVSSARNLGLDNAKGDYICFIDDDDVVSPSYLSELYVHARKDIVSISNIYSFKFDIHEHLENFFICPLLKKKNCYRHASLYKIRSFLSFPVAKMIHQDIIGTRRFDPRFTNGEDALFITSLSDKIKGLSFTTHSSVYYVRERMGSASRKKIPVKVLFKQSFLLICAYANLYISNFPKYNLLLFISRVPGVLKNAILLYRNNK